MAKRIYFSTIKKWMLGLGIGSIPVAIGLFMYLSTLGVITNVVGSGDMICAGTDEFPCIAYINFTAKDDIFIYPDGNWSKSLFYTNGSINEAKIYRSWGNSWREIKLNETCTGTWCGAPNSKGVAYSFVFRNNQDYMLKITAKKEVSTGNIKWGFGDSLDPNWKGIDIDTAVYYKNKTKKVSSISDTLKFKNTFLGVNTTLKRITPQINKVIYGKNRTIVIININSSFITPRLFDELELYQIEDGVLKPVDRTYQFKYAEYVPVQTGRVSSVCSGMITLENGTEANDCSLVKDYVTETITRWLDFDSAKVYSGSYDIAIITDVEKGETGEWIMSFNGIRNPEWATWTDSLTNGLTNYWQFDDANSNATFTTDIVFGRNNGTPIPTTGLIRDTGVIGQAYNFSGTSQWMMINNNISSFGYNFAISLWIYPSNVPDGATMFLKGKDSPYNSLAIWLGQGDSNKGQKIELTYENQPAGGPLVNSGIIPKNGEWTHVMVNQNNSGIYLWVNGSMTAMNTQLFAPTAGAYGVLNSTRFAKGFSSFAGVDWKGAIDEVAMWNRSLTASEIVDLYNGGVGITYSASIPDTVYPQFSNFWDNNGTLLGNGTALFNVTASGTNGTVFLNINGTNFTASNTTARNNYNVSIGMINNTYPYYWWGYGNGTLHLFNSTGYFYYTVNTSTADVTYPVINFTYPSESNNSHLSRTSVWFNFSSTDDNFANITITIDKRDQNIVIIKASQTGNYRDGHIHEVGDEFDIYDGGGLTEMKVGDEGSGNHYRSFIDFDTSSIPDNAIVTNVSIRLSRFSGGGSGSFNITGLSNFSTDTLKYDFPSNLWAGCGLDGADDSSFGVNNLVNPIYNATATPFNGIGLDTPVNITLNSVAIQNLSAQLKDNFFSLCILSEAYNSEFNSLVTSESTTDAWSPFLIVTYKTANITTYTTEDFFINYTSLSDGTYFVNAIARDISSNSNQTETRIVTIDTVYPKINFTYLSDTNGTTLIRNSVWFNFTLIESNYANLTVTISNSSLVNSTVYYNSSGKRNFFTNFTGLADGTYFINATTYDSYGNQNTTETRTVSVYYQVYPTFSNLVDNNNTFDAPIFNVTIDKTNGTVFLNINGTNFTASNSTYNVFNVSIPDLASGVFPYYWFSYGNTSFSGYNKSQTVYYTLRRQDLIVPTNTEITLAETQSYRSIFVGINATIHINQSYGWLNLSATKNITILGIIDGYSKANNTIGAAASGGTTAFPCWFGIGGTGDNGDVSGYSGGSGGTGGGSVGGAGGIGGNGGKNYSLVGTINGRNEFIFGNGSGGGGGGGAGGGSGAESCGSGSNGGAGIIGARGGAVVKLKSPIITISGIINVTGGNGGDGGGGGTGWVSTGWPGSGGGGGGGGSGGGAGQIIIDGNNINISSASLIANGGNNGLGGSLGTGYNYGSVGIDGMDGVGGRIKVFYSSLVNSSSIVSVSGEISGTVYYEIYPKVNVTLINPINDTDLVGFNSTFEINSSVLDSLTLKNLTLYIWNSSGIYYNRTFNITHETNTTTVYYNFTDSGVYYWNAYAEATNYSLLGSFAPFNNTLFINPHNVTVEFLSPDNDAWISSNEFYIEVYMNDFIVKNVTYSIYNNTALVNLTNFEYRKYFVLFDNLRDDNYSIEVNVTDHIDRVNSTGIRKNINIDTIYPIINFTSFTTSTNETVSFTTVKSIFANVSITEKNYKNVSFSLYSYLGILNITDYNYTSTIRHVNWTNLPENNYYWNVTTCDWASNCNTTDTRHFGSKFLNLTIEGLSTNVDAELGTILELNFSYSNGDVCIDINHHNYGNNYSCVSGLNTINLNITNFRKSNLANGNINLTVSYSGNEINDTAISYTLHSYDDIDSLSFNITGNNNITSLIIYTINTTSIERAYQGELIGNLVHSDMDAYNNKTIDLIFYSSYPQTSYFYVDDNAHNLTFIINVSGGKYGLSFSDIFNNWSLIDEDNTTAQLDSSGYILPRNSSKQWFTYDNYDPSVSAGAFSFYLAGYPCAGSSYSADLEEVLDSYWHLYSHMDCDNILDYSQVRYRVNTTKISLLDSDNIYFNLSFNYNSLELRTAGYAGVSYCSGDVDVSLGDSDLYSIIIPPTTASVSTTETASGAVTFNFTKINSTTWNVKIGGFDTGYQSYYSATCQWLRIDRNWTAGTIGYDYSGCADSVGSLASNINFTVNHLCGDLSANGISIFLYSQLDFGGLTNLRCDYSNLDVYVNKIYRSLYSRSDSSVVSLPIYESTANIPSATLTAAGLVTDGEAVQLYLSNDNGVTWTPATGGVLTNFASSGSTLRWGATFGIGYDGYRNVTSFIKNVSISIPEGYPSNLSFDFGDDGIIDYVINGQLNESNPQSIDLSSGILNFSGTSDNGKHLFGIPLKISSNNTGLVHITKINLTYNPNPIVINTTSIQDYIRRFVGWVNFSIPFGATNGNVTVSDVRLDYAGGNKTYSLIIHPTDYSSNLSRNITYSYSKWDYNIVPYNVYYLEFIPKTPTSKSVMPYGQTNSTPILNITNYGYGSKYVNLSFYLNETLACVNTTISVDNNKSHGYLLNNSWIQLNPFGWDRVLDFDSTSGQGSPVGNLSSDRKQGYYSYNATTGRNMYNTVFTWLLSKGLGVDVSRYANSSNGLGNSWLSMWVKIENCSLTSMPSGKCSLDNFEFGNANNFNQTLWDVDALANSPNMTSNNWTYLILNFNQSVYNSLDNINWSDVRYIEAYVSNKSTTQTRVYFDDLQIHSNPKIDGIGLNHLDSLNIWMWADYACNYSTWKYYNPNLFVRQCCQTCICSGDVR